MRNGIRSSIFFLGAWCLLGALANCAYCQEPADSGNLNAADKLDASSDSGKLDKLLELAEKDLGGLSQVRVGGQTGSPSLDTQVSTVSRQPATIGQTPAAVFVVTNEMIRRSGAKTIPDVLRLVPGVHVAQIDSNIWAISIRGFDWRFSNKLLVQIDGRMIYTPIFGGVYWDEQDVLLEDVERIEVIRGPGASVWGANAVNGIINIVTKNSKNTQGTYVESGAGTKELGYANLRYGGGNGDDLHYRFYGKWFERDSGYLPDGLPTYDEWRQARGGFRMDWDADDDDHVTFQGDYYNGYDGEKRRAPAFMPPFYEITSNTAHVSGANALVRWTHDFSDESDCTSQIYYNRMDHHWLTMGVVENYDLFDFDFQHRFPAGDRQEWIWGFGFRNTRDESSITPTFALVPPSRSYKVISFFVQDRITLVEDRLFLTAGSKFEYNDFTNFEYQPTIRLLWAPDDKRSIWGAVSRAVRTPTRGELNGYILQAPYDEIPLPLYPTFFGNPDLVSEELIAYELGYREQTTERFSWDLTVFLNKYERLNALYSDDPIPLPWGGVLLPYHFENSGAGEGYGFEIALNYAVRPDWKLQGNYTFFVLELAPLNFPNFDYGTEKWTPRNAFSLTSSWDLGRKWELDLIGRYMDKRITNPTTPDGDIPNYFVADVRLAWKPRKNFEWSVVGRNLLEGPHPEYGNDVIFNVYRTEVQQEVYTQIIWRH